MSGQVVNKSTPGWILKRFLHSYFPLISTPALTWANNKPKQKSPGNKFYSGFIALPQGVSPECRFEDIKQVGMVSNSSEATNSFLEHQLAENKFAWPSTASAGETYLFCRGAILYSESYLPSASSMLPMRLVVATRFVPLHLASDVQPVISSVKSSAIGINGMYRTVALCTMLNHCWCRPTAVQCHTSVQTCVICVVHVRQLKCKPTRV